MIAFPKENQTQQQTDKDVVCPKCFKPLQGKSVLQTIPDRYGRKLRKYFGWCIENQAGFEVIQFLKDNHWHIHKYQLYRAISPNIYRPEKKWIVLNELPEPAPVVVGPGGDFDKQITLDVTTILKNLQSILETTSQTIKNLIKMAELKK